MNKIVIVLGIILHILTVAAIVIYYLQLPQKLFRQTFKNHAGRITEITKVKLKSYLLINNIDNIYLSTAIREKYFR